jgi:flagellar hook-basal body complex protein FliE
MPNPVSAITSLPSLDAPSAIRPSGKPGEFQNVLDGTIKTLESFQNNAANAVQDFLTGENEELHTAVLATQKAEIAFDLGLQVRNKVVSAYQEIMRMQM